MQSLYSKRLDLTAKEILGINLDDPECLFPKSADAVTSAYRELARKWHPDRSKDPKAAEAFDHLTKLRGKAEEKLASGTWQEAGLFTCRLKDGRAFQVRSDARRPFELGTMHISPTTITYVVKREYEDLFKSAVALIGSLGFADDKMKKVCEASLPVVFKTYESADSLILTVRKGADYILMRDLMPAIPRDNLGRHVAWEMGRLHDMVRYLDYAGIVHNDITPDTVFVSPESHSIGLFGGWWYAARMDESLKAVPAAAEEFISDDSLATGRPDPKTDLEMIRACGRELLGDRGGTRLPMLKAAPPPMIDYLRQPSSGSAQKDLEHWYQQVLPASFGARRFVKLPVTYSDIYQPKGV